MFGRHANVATVAFLTFGLPSFAPTRAARAASSGTELLYEFEKPGPGYHDLVALDNGAKYIGKMLQWGTDVFVYDCGGRRRVLDSSAVSSIRLRRDPALTTRPALPDLTVASIERARKGDGPNATLELKIHVLNAGSVESKPFDYRISIDGKPMASGRVDQPIAPDQIQVVEAAVAAPADATGELRVELDIKKENQEIARWNDTLVEPVSAVEYLVFVARSRQEAFCSARNCVDTFCIEDWLQYHFRMTNELLRRSVHPSAPDGIAARARLAAIIVEADLPEQIDAATRDRLRKTAGDRPMIVLTGWPAGGSANDAAGMADWTICRDIGLGLGLLDLAKLESPVRQCMLRDSFGDFVQRGYRLPGPDSMMRNPGPHAFSEIDASFLNRTQPEERRAAGAYFASLPAECGLIVLDNAGRPLRGVDVTLFQPTDTGQGGPLIVEPAVVIGETDPAGRLVLPPREGKPANPWGAIAPDGSNSLFLARLRKDANEEYHFISIHDYLLAAARGAKETFDLSIRTNLTAAPNPEAPRYCRLKYDLDDPLQRRGYLTWPASKGAEVLEYRVYVRESRTAPQWTLVAVVGTERIGVGGVAAEMIELEPLRLGRPSAGTTFAVSCANKQGVEGALSPSRYIPSGLADSAKLAVIPDSKPSSVVFSLQGALNDGLIKSNFNQFHDDYGVRTTRFPGYEPWGGGVAFDDRKRLVLTDPYNHKVGWYEQAELVQLAGKAGAGPASASAKTGEFNTPLDVAVDEKGRVYVADAANNRVQELDARGQFVRLFKEADGEAEGLFTRPAALGLATGRLCVTDTDGERIQIFDITGTDPKRIRILRQLRDADRALVGASGRVYVPAKNEAGKDAVLIYPITPNEERGVERPERYVDRLINGEVRGPRGFCPDGGGNAFYVTSFPFVIQRFTIE